MFISVTLFAEPEIRIKCLAFPGISPSEITLNLEDKSHHPMAGLSEVSGIMTITGSDFAGGSESYSVHTRPKWNGVSWSAESLKQNRLYTLETDSDLFHFVGAMKLASFTVKSGQQIEHTADLVCARVP